MASTRRVAEPGDKVRVRVPKVMRKPEAAFGDNRKHVTIRARPFQGTLGNVRKDVGTGVDTDGGSRSCSLKKKKKKKGWSGPSGHLGTLSALHLS